MISLDDGRAELAVITDVSQGGASLSDGSLELMVHRRVMEDDSRGVQEPLNETMCGCNDIGADPGHMGAHGHEGDGGCECAGLTVRGRHWIVFDTIENAHAARRTLSEELNFPPLMAMVPAATSLTSDTSHSSVTPTTYTAVAKALPSNIKLVTLTNNYASHTDGAYLLRLSHLYAAGEHPTLAQPVTVDLSDIFTEAGLRITSATETTLTANQPLADVEARKHTWRAHAPNQAVAEHFAQVKGRAFERRVPFDFPNVTIRPMEVRTFLATFE
jgi:alpha-mannosidase